jgi:hypothetical protein
LNSEGRPTTKFLNQSKYLTTLNNDKQYLDDACKQKREENKYFTKNKNENISLFDEQSFIFNNRTTLGKSRQPNFQKNKLKKKLADINEYPFSKVSEINLIKKEDIEYYKDLLSISKQGNLKKKKNFQ